MDEHSDCHPHSFSHTGSMSSIFLHSLPPHLHQVNVYDLYFRQGSEYKAITDVYILQMLRKEYAPSIVEGHSTVIPWIKAFIPLILVGQTYWHALHLQKWLFPFLASFHFVSWLLRFIFEVASVWNLLVMMLHRLKKSIMLWDVKWQSRFLTIICLYQALNQKVFSFSC